MLYRIIIFSCILLGSPFSGFKGFSASADEFGETGGYRIYDRYSTPWVDSVFQSLTIEERIAQLLMIRVHTDKEPVKPDPISDFLMLQLLVDEEKTYYDSITDIIDRYNIGGIAFFRGYPHRQLKKTNHFQEHARTPLFIAMDAEWGLGMRLDSTISFPQQMTLGAIAGEKHIYETGMEIARQLRRIGTHINFAPVADVNSNPLNPVINFRSFGECRYNVSRKSSAYMMGMQDWGIIATAKHFPGHGDTYADSHNTLPVIDHDHKLIDSLHLYPFRQLFNNGVKSVMTAHLNIPAYDNTKNLAASLSNKVVTGLLQNKMGFEGLIITDALDMKGVSDYFEPGELELMALKAGNDILLLPENVPLAIKTIKNAIEKGKISEDLLNKKCRKILFYKEMIGLDNYKPANEYDLNEDLNTQKALLLNKKLIENAITLIKNNNDVIPVKNFDTLKIASLAIGADSINRFQNILTKYYPVDLFTVSRNYSNSQLKEIIERLHEYNLVIISLHNNSKFPALNYGVNDNIISFIQDISKDNSVILNLFANPYVLNFFDKITDIESILISYQDGDLYEEVSAQVIFGGIPARGKLPVSATPFFPVGTGIKTPENFRVRFASPEETGVSPDIINTMDSIAEKGISAKAYPGAQVVVIKDGNVIVNRSYGHHTYDRCREVKNSDIYDLASLTKIAATTAAIMHMKSNDLIDIDKKVGYYLPWLKDSNIEGIILRDILAHQSGLRSWIPFYLETIDRQRPDPQIYRNKYSKKYPVKVAENMFIHKNYCDTLFQKIAETPLLSGQKYVYSDLGFYILAEIIKELSAMSLDEYMRVNFYAPMGLHTMTFNPLEKFDKTRIVPTEKDTLFRRQLLRGHVHDPGAAMLGGVSGHAGLFSNALDMAVMMQMFLQNGYYGGQQFICEKVLKEFTSRQYDDNKNRRGLGFDKPSTDDNGFPASRSASPHSYGHSGFTGTFAWADPEENLVYVFLANRIHPFASNRKLIDMNIRAEILQAIYNAIYKTKYLETHKVQ